MTNLDWLTRRNLENSLIDHLRSQITAQSLTIFHEGENKSLNVQVGFPEDDSWCLPNIAVYIDTKASPRGFIGSNKRLRTWLMIIDIRALDDGMRSDIAEWVQENITEGFPYNEYAPDSATPDTPIKTLTGIVNVEFISDTPVRLQNVDQFDKYRHNISASLEINGGGI